MLRGVLVSSRTRHCPGSWFARGELSGVLKMRVQYLQRVSEPLASIGAYLALTAASVFSVLWPSRVAVGIMRRF